MGMETSPDPEDGVRLRIAAGLDVKSLDLIVGRTPVRAFVAEVTVQP